MEKLLVNTNTSRNDSTLSNNNSQENSGVLSGLFRRSPKALRKAGDEPSGMLGWIFRNPFTSSAQEREKPEPLTCCREVPVDQPAESVPVVGNSGRTDSNESMDEAPRIPARPSEEELSRTISHRLSLLSSVGMDHNQELSVDQCKTKGDAVEGSEEHGGEHLWEDLEHKKMKSTEEEGLMANTAPKNLKIANRQCNAETETKMPETSTCSDHAEQKKKKVKKKNPFMPHVTTKGKMNKAVSSEPVENNIQKKSLMDQLNELRLDRTHKDEDKDPEDLMKWWSTVKQWEQVPKDEDYMTDTEEAKAFAVTAEKVQRGIHVFNQLFTERVEGLWQHVIDLHAIADSLDRFNWRTKVAQITGGSTSAVGGVTTIAGLALAPVTMGTSLIVTAVGLGVATAGGLTSASAGISNAVNNSLDRKKVERIVEDYQCKMADLNKCMNFIKQGIENLRQFNLLKIKRQAYNRDFPGLNGIYEEGAMASKAVLINANEIMRMVQIANVAGSTAARAVQVASMATGVLTGLFVGMDVYFVAKDSQELRKGAKSEFAAKIREVAEQLHQGLMELNVIRGELQCSSTSDSSTCSTSLPALPQSAEDEHQNQF
ncbi:apolipoprotein L1 isoform X2 [Brachyhypopomus gauderio]|uniref:apolipoprotein L1 isoform X2 n=1 Tax=Brachyhypopomus gauderio TaxID=698409 RepID=UPI0040430825